MKRSHSPAEQDNPALDQAQASQSKSKKRKTSARLSTSGRPARATRRSTASSRSSKTDKQDEKTKTIRFLLSDEALGMINRVQKDENEDHTTKPGRGKSFSFPRDQLNPFQTLLAALLLSKPFSHVIATRAIETVFSPGQDDDDDAQLGKGGGLVTPGKVRELGFDAIYALLERARTLHRQKTAQQIVDLAEVCCSASGSSQGSSSGAEHDAELGWLIKDVDGADEAGSERKHKGSSAAQSTSLDMPALKSSIVKRFKGYGPKTVEIFLRRVQSASRGPGFEGEGAGPWAEVYPFADENALVVAREAGLIGSGEGAEELAEVVRSADAGGEEGMEDTKTAAAGDRERRDFGRVVDVLVYLSLEGKVQEALHRASSSAAQD